MSIAAATVTARSAEDGAAALEKGNTRLLQRGAAGARTLRFAASAGTVQ